MVSEELRNRIWIEFVNTKHDLEYLYVYSRFQAVVARLINIFIVIFSTSGVLSWILDNPKYSGIACVLTMLVAFIKEVSPYFLLSEKENRKLDKYYLELVKHFDSIEKFWFNTDVCSNEDDKIRDNFYSLKEKGSDLHSKFMEISIVHLKFLIKKADVNARDYITGIFKQS